MMIFNLQFFSLFLRLAINQFIRRWSKPATGMLALGTLTDLTRSRTDLLVENAMLRQQLIILNRQTNRPRLTNHDRFRLVILSRFTSFWQQALHVVQPDTLLRWHRELFRIYWRRKSKSNQHKPHISPEIIALIKQMAQENRLWGAERIRGELLKLGIKVSKRTIQRYLPKKRTKSNQTWGTFLKNHAAEIWACDFTVVHDLFFRPTYIFIIIELHTRRILHTAVTLAPTDAWTAQQLREATPWGQGPRYLLHECAHDRDSKFGRKFAGVAASSGIKELRFPIRAPKANAVCERIIGSLKRECRQAISIEMACRSYAHLASFPSAPTYPAIRRVLQFRPTTPGYSPTDTRTLCSISALNSEVFTSENHFKTRTRWAAPPLPLHAPFELNLIVPTG